MSASKHLTDTLRTAFAFYLRAHAEGNQGMMDFLAGRLDAHAKWAWFLRATSKS